MRPALKSVMFASGRSQRQIAARANIPENKLSEIVRGWADPTDAERAALIRELGCSADVFDRDALEARSR